MFAVANGWQMSKVKNQYDNLNFMARDSYQLNYALKNSNRVYHLTVHKGLSIFNPFSHAALQIDNPYDLDGMVPNFNILTDTSQNVQRI